MTSVLGLAFVLVLIGSGWCGNDEATTIISETRTEISITDMGKAFNPALGEDDNDLDLDFDYDDEPHQHQHQTKNTKASKEQAMRQTIQHALKKPAFKEQIGQVIPILRAMSPTQRLTLAALVSSQMMSAHEPVTPRPDIAQVASMFAGKRIDSIREQNNVSESLLLPISIDIANMFKGLGKDMGRSLRQEYSGSVHRARTPTKPRVKTRLVRRPVPTKPTPPVINRRSDKDISDEITDSLPAAEALRRQPSPEDCEYFSSNLCLEVSYYPKEAIMGSIKKHRDVLDTLLADYKQQSADANIDGVSTKQESKYQPHHYFGKSNRRQDTVEDNEVRDFGAEGGYMCPSAVKYARPKRARTTSGQWKYIVNTGEYTQTLRMEMCLKPLSPCSYVTDNFKSQCTQVYNYHRLLTWDDTKGLHMDIFKVPSCCSCHIQGYSSLFPPHAEFTYADPEIAAQPELTPQASSPPFAVQPATHRPYTSMATKREASRPGKDAGKPNLADHLVPPSLPQLELLPQRLKSNNTALRSPYEVTNRGGKPLESGRRPLKPTEVTRTSSKATERIDFSAGPGISGYGPISGFASAPGSKNGPSGFGPSGFGSKIRTKPPPNILPHHRPNMARPRPTPPKIQHVAPPKVTLPKTTLFVTPHPPQNELIIEPGSKPNTKAPVKYFDPDINEVKPQLSRSTATPPLGGKRVNYNYHPIIDFFTSETSNKKPSPLPPSQPSFSPLISHDWTPMVSPEGTPAH